MTLEIINEWSEISSVVVAFSCPSVVDVAGGICHYFLGKNGDGLSHNGVPARTAVSDAFFQ